MKREFDFFQMLDRGIDALDLSVAQEAVPRLHSYFTELQRWNKKINLIAKGSSPSSIVENHFLDSLTLLPFLTGTDVHLLDVGTGAGFPGLVCGAVRPELKITLVEPRLKRVSFLRHMVRTLKLEQIRVVADRIECLDPDAKENHYTHITSRAVSDMATFFQMVHPLLASGTQIICMKGARWQEEVKQVEKEGGPLASSDLKLTDKKLFSLPFSKADRALLLYCKSSADS